MAKRPQKEVTKDLLQGRAVTKALVAHALGRVDLTRRKLTGHSVSAKGSTKTYTVDDSRIRVGLALLNKLLPDLASQRIEGGFPAGPQRYSVTWTTEPAAPAPGKPAADES